MSRVKDCVECLKAMAREPGTFGERSARAEDVVRQFRKDAEQYCITQQISNVDGYAQKYMDKLESAISSEITRLETADMIESLELSILKYIACEFSEL